MEDVLKYCVQKVLCLNEECLYEQWKWFIPVLCVCLGLCNGLWRIWEDRINRFRRWKNTSRRSEEERDLDEGNWEKRGKVKNEKWLSCEQRIATLPHIKMSPDWVVITNRKKKKWKVQMKETHRGNKCRRSTFLKKNGVAVEIKKII